MSTSPEVTVHAEPEGPFDGERLPMRYDLELPGRHHETIRSDVLAAPIDEHRSVRELDARERAEALRRMLEHTVLITSAVGGDDRRRAEDRVLLASVGWAPHRTADLVAWGYERDRMVRDWGGSPWREALSANTGLALLVLRRQRLIGGPYKAEWRKLRPILDAGEAAADYVRPGDLLRRHLLLFWHSRAVEVSAWPDPLGREHRVGEGVREPVGERKSRPFTPDEAETFVDVAVLCGRLAEDGSPPILLCPEGSITAPSS